MGGGLGRVSHHPDYYLEDGSVSFLAGGVLFRVHKTFFNRESAVFRDLFETAAMDNPPSGTDACPFTLDVHPDEFAQFLWVWYDREYSYRQQTKDNWLIILRLAKRWHFDKITELALREIEYLELPPAERISIYDAYGVDGDRLISSYVELCKSPSLPTEAEARLMRMDTLIKLLQAREDAQRKADEIGHVSPTSACLEDDALREIISMHFKTGLNPQPSGTSTGSGDQAPDLNTGSNHKTIKLGDPHELKAKTMGSHAHINDTPATCDDVQKKRREGEQTEEDKARATKEKGKQAEKKDKEKTKEEKKAEEKENAQAAKEAEKKAKQNSQGRHRN